MGPYYLFWWEVLLSSRFWRFYKYWDDIDSPAQVKPRSQASSNGLFVCAISKNQKLDLVIFKSRQKVDAAAYSEEIVKNVVAPFILANRSGRFVFQQDNAPIHTAETTRRVFETYDIAVTVLKYSPEFMVLNVIQALLRQIRALFKSSYTQRSHHKIIWSYPTRIYSHLVASIPHRCQRVIENGGNCGNSKKHHVPLPQPNIEDIVAQAFELSLNL